MMILYLNQIERIRIGHNGANPGAGWFLDEVRIDVPSRGQQYVFVCHRWLDKKEEDGQLEIEMTPTHVQQEMSASMYNKCLYRKYPVYIQVNIEVTPTLRMQVSIEVNPTHIQKVFASKY